MPSRETTTIHVGDIDLKSEIQRKSTDPEDEACFSPPLNLSENSAMINIPQNVSADLNVVPSKPNSDALCQNDNTSSNPKQSLWQLTKLLGQKVGTKLSLKKEKSSASQSNAKSNASDNMTKKEKLIDDHIPPMEDMLKPNEANATGGKAETNSPVANDISEKLESPCLEHKLESYNSAMESKLNERDCRDKSDKWRAKELMTWKNKTNANGSSGDDEKRKSDKSATLDDQSILKEPPTEEDKLERATASDNKQPKVY